MINTVITTLKKQAKFTVRSKTLEGADTTSKKKAFQAKCNGIYFALELQAPINYLSSWMPYKKTINPTLPLRRSRHMIFLENTATSQVTFTLWNKQISYHLREISRQFSPLGFPFDNSMLSNRFPGVQVTGNQSSNLRKDAIGILLTHSSQWSGHLGQDFARTERDPKAQEAGTAETILQKVLFDPGAAVEMNELNRMLFHTLATCGD